MAKRQAAKKPLAKKPRRKSGSPIDKSKVGCASSFIMGERNEMDKRCGNLRLDNEYVQPDEEKEVGGES